MKPVNSVWTSSTASTGVSQSRSTANCGVGSSSSRTNFRLPVVRTSGGADSPTCRLILSCHAEMRLLQPETWWKIPLQWAGFHSISYKIHYNYWLIWNKLKYWIPQAGTMVVWNIYQIYSGILSFLYRSKYTGTIKTFHRLILN